MMNFTSDQWMIVALIFVLGLLLGGFLFSGGGRKWKQRYKSEVDRRTEVEQTYASREKEWREQDSLRAAALKDRERGSIAERDRVGNGIRTDRDGDGVRDDRDPVDDRKL